MHKLSHEQIGNQLRLLRTQRNLSQKQVASTLKIHPSQLSKIERGKINPSLDVVLSIAALLGAEIRVIPREAPAE